PGATAEGHIYLAGKQPGQQTISQFFVSDAWGPNMTWDDANRAMGANIRSLEAPAASGDGKVTIYNVDNLLADPGVSSIQALATLPDLPSWLTPVGMGYYIALSTTTTLTRAVVFQYLQRDVPDGYEHTLTLYYLPDEQGDNPENAWQRLPTGPLESGVDPHENLAATPFRGAGIYALMATASLPTLVHGWNAFSYPVAASQSVTAALASLAGDYTSVYGYKPSQSYPWPLYDATVPAPYAAAVNTLHALDYGSVYLIHITATVPVTPYIGIGDSASAAQALSQPPATYYGPLLADAPLSDGSRITALIDNVVCGVGTVSAPPPGIAAANIYVIQVRADSGDGCGAAGKALTFRIDNVIWEPSESLLWENAGAHLVPLAIVNAQGVSPQEQIYLPLVVR
ncbi:MAG: hypothetical protein KDE31_38410, partial [Caldilineaceae bacterium]|nr:hypothetical protein [Caldilineaceae bacterium]